MVCLEVHQSLQSSSSIACLIIEGVIAVIYIGDIIVIAETYEECLIGAIKTIKLFLKLGSIIQPEKSS